MDNTRELTLKIGENPETLEKTVAAWNASCAAGNDAEFGRNPKRMAPIQSLPFYAVEFVPRLQIRKEVPGGMNLPRCSIPIANRSQVYTPVENSDLCSATTIREGETLPNALHLAASRVNALPLKNPGPNVGLH